MRRVRTTREAHFRSIQPRTGVLVRVTRDRNTGRDIAIVLWDGNRTQSRISVDFIEDETKQARREAALQRLAELGQEWDNG